MPGIVAIISRMPRRLAEPQLLQMLGTMQHESFYTTGTWIDESAGVYLGWTALQGSFADSMPLRDERGDSVLVFSGEEYSASASARGSASYLLDMYEQDPDFLRKLNGRFHGLTIDRRSRTATVFNDRFGMHRLYVHQASDATYFAAEAKAILAVRPELRRPDFRGLGELVACGAVLENRTVFQGIGVLPPGSAWEFCNGTLERRETYFEPREWEEQGELEPEIYYRELRSVFQQSLPRYFSGALPVGMSLTGGLDSRMIMAMHKSPAGSLPCYTFGSMFREHTDVKVARRVADVCQQPFQVITAGRQFLAEFSSYAERTVYLSDGCVDVGRAPDLYLNQLARAIAPVRVAGIFGSEILRGSISFKPEKPQGGIFSTSFDSQIDRAGETYRQIREGNTISFAAFRQAPWHMHGTVALETTQVVIRAPFLDNDMVRMAYRSPVAALASSEISWRLIADGDRDLLNIPTDRGASAGHGRMRDATSHAFQEFLFKAEYAYDMGMPQWLARLDHSLAFCRFERLFLGRHKPFHFRVWYRDALANYLREVLLDSRSLSRPWVERRKVEAAVESHIRGERNYTNELHKVLTLELLHRVLLEGRTEGTYLPPVPAESRLGYGSQDIFSNSASR
jgi:asparagine synthase (glutamine-hydrolysing)